MFNLKFNYLLIWCNLSFFKIFKACNARYFISAKAALAQKNVLSVLHNCIMSHKSSLIRVNDRL